MLAVYTVEKSGFVKMLAKFNPRYDLPSRNYFSRATIPLLYSEVKSDIQQQITNGLFFYAGTTDPWSSLISEPYLSYMPNVFKHITCLKHILASICKKHWSPCYFSGV